MTALRHHMPLYGWIMIVVVLAFALGIRLGRHHPYPAYDVGGFHLFHHEPGIFDWFDRHV